MSRSLVLATAVALALLPHAGAGDELKTATVAGGCFWCVEADFEKVPGVAEVVSGYTGGTVEEPTYEEVSAGGTGHREAAQIRYDPGKVTYEELLAIFWRTIDPTDPGGQFCDRGESYTTAVFVENAEQRRAAEASKKAAEEALGRTIVTPIEEAGPFYRAEEYHQDYYRKSSLQYGIYRWSCGRNARVEELWGEAAYDGLPELG